MNQIVLNHSGFRVQASAEPKDPQAAVMVSAKGYGLEMTRLEAEALAVLLDAALHATGPRQNVPIDLTGPDAPVFLRRQAD